MGVDDEGAVDDEALELSLLPQGFLWSFSVCLLEGVTAISLIQASGTTFEVRGHRAVDISGRCSGGNHDDLSVLQEQ